MLLSLEKRDAVSVGQDFSHYIRQLVSAGTWQVWHPTHPLPPAVRLLHRDFRIENSLTAPPACRGLGQSILLTTWSSFLLLFFIRTWFNTKRVLTQLGRSNHNLKWSWLEGGHREMLPLTRPGKFLPYLRMDHHPPSPQLRDSSTDGKRAAARRLPGSCEERKEAMVGAKGIFQCGVKRGARTSCRPEPS